MKKNILSLLIIIAPFFLYAQPYSNKDKMLISARIDTLLQKYMQKNTLTEPGSTHQNPKVVKEFKSLFATDAKIFDDINASFDENEKGYPYKLREKSLNEYYTGLIEEFATGLIITNKRVNISYVNFDKGEISAALQRNITGTNSKKYDLANDDTLLIKISIQPDKSVKIQSIASLGNTQVKVVNDDDLDGVIDSKDNCRGRQGKLSLNGCPDADNDGIDDDHDECKTDSGSVENRGCPASTFAYSYVFSGSVGYQMNHNQIDMPTDGFVNKPLDDDSDFGNASAKHSFKGSFSLNANIAYYFGKKKNNRNKGISFGFSLTRYSDKYTLKDVKYFYAAKDQNTLAENNFWSILTADSVIDNLSFSIINFPLQVRFKSRVKKIGWEIGAGPSFIIFTAKSSNNAAFNFEAIYPGNSHNLNATDVDYKWSKHDLIWIADSINSHRIDPDIQPDAAHYFDSLNTRGYFLGHHSLENDGNQITRSSFAFNANADLFYHLNSYLAVKAGFAVVYTIVKGNSGPYSIVNDDTRTYHSFYNGKGKSHYYSFGLNFGIILGI